MAAPSTSSGPGTNPDDLDPVDFGGALYRCPIPNLVASRIPEKNLYSGGVGNPLLDVDNVEHETAYNVGNPNVQEALHLFGLDKAEVSFTSPCLVRVADHLPPGTSLGTYYLYFSHHKGGHIRMAFADQIDGPYKEYLPGDGVFRLPKDFTYTVDDASASSVFPIPRSVSAPPPGPDGADHLSDHVASPNVFWDHATGRFVMYFHTVPQAREDSQVTYAATSADGLNWEFHPEVLGSAYFASFRWRGGYYALTTRGPIFRSLDAISGFEAGPTPSDDIGAYRHFGVWVVGDCLWVFYSRWRVDPETIYVTTIDLSMPFEDWKFTTAVEEPKRALVLDPLDGFADYDGRKVLDPFIFEDEYGQLYLLYSADDEKAIAMAKLDVIP